MRRVKGVRITPHNCKIQDMDDDFYKQFQMVVSGLDSIEARRWINAKLVALAEEGGGPDSIKPMIDGGTEGELALTRRLASQQPLLTGRVQDSRAKRG